MSTEAGCILIWMLSSLLTAIHTKEPSESLLESCSDTMFMGPFGLVLITISWWDWRNIDKS